MTSASFRFALLLAALTVLSRGPAHAQQKVVPAAAPDSNIVPFSQESALGVSGVFNAGNISALSAKANGFYQARYRRHSFRVELAGGVFGQAVDTDTNPVNGFEVALYNNINTQLLGKARYDFYATEDDTVYTAFSPAHDSAGNLAMRWRAEAGYRRFLFRLPNQSLSVEAGLVYSLDYAPLEGDTDGNGKVDTKDRLRFEKSGGTVGGRIMVSYAMAITDRVTASQGVELVPNFFPAVEAPYEQARYSPGADNKLGFLEATTVASTTNITVSLTSSISAGGVLAITYDNGALARRNAYSTTDISTSLALNAKLF